MIATADIAALVTWLMRALGVTRVLQIGCGDPALPLAIAATLPPAGTSIAIEPDHAQAAAIRRAASDAGLAAGVSVMIGLPTRYLHKLAGPFDLIVVGPGIDPALSLHDRLLPLLDAAGVLVCLEARAREGYNELCAADGRMHTILIDVGGGVALSTRSRGLDA